MGTNRTPFTRPRHGTFNELRRLIARSPRKCSLNLAATTQSPWRNVVELRREFDAIAVVDLPLEIHDVFSYVQRAAPPGPRDAIFVFGLDRVLGRERDTEIVCRALNASPRRWKAWYAYPIVFWVDGAKLDAVQQQTPDFWEWQAGVFRLNALGATEPNQT